MASFVHILTTFNFHSWKGDMEIQLRARGVYRFTMDTEEEPTHVTYKAIFLNKKDEAFVFLCLSISRDLLFHLSGLKTPKEIWANELMSLQPSNFETLNDFFTKFKHIVLLLKQ